MIIIGMIMTLPTDKLKLQADKMKYIKRFINYVRLEIAYRKKLKELRKRDPFIYK